MVISLISLCANALLIISFFADKICENYKKGKVRSLKLEKTKSF